MSDHMSRRLDRINAAMDAICRGKRLEAADRHCTAQRLAEEMAPPLQRDRQSDAYHSFLAGWDAAMALRHDELADENHELHSVIFDLVTRLHIRRCEHCKGEGVTEDAEVCEHCIQGWVDIEPGESNANQG